VSAPPPVVVTLRPATAQDCRQVWLWRNDEETRRVSLDSAAIPLEAHERWFLDSLQSPSRRIYIVVAGDQPSGVARLDVDGGQGIVSIHLAPECRGRGVGPRALEALGEVAFGPLGLARLVAEIKADNAASLSAFVKAGFAPSRAGPVLHLVRVRRES
jgi:UDP-2,4-diacetamido-2,4,6-trideoxy-beta-L-altropyranose hydrolase